MKILDVATLLDILVAPAVAKSAPFRVGDRINCTKHDRVNDPSVAVIDLNTGEVFMVELLYDVTIDDHVLGYGKKGDTERISVLGVN